MFDRDHYDWLFLLRAAVAGWGSYVELWDNGKYHNLHGGWGWSDALCTITATCPINSSTGFSHDTLACVSKCPMSQDRCQERVVRVVVVMCDMTWHYYEHSACISRCNHLKWHAYKKFWSFNMQGGGVNGSGCMIACLCSLPMVRVGAYLREQMKFLNSVRGMWITRVEFPYATKGHSWDEAKS